MKLRIIYGLIFYSVLYSSVQAQNAKVKFHSIENGGVIIGESEANAVFQTVNGVAVSDWFFGIGFGVDYYQYKTLPLFLDTRSFFGKKQKWFLYGNLGYNFASHNKPGKEFFYYDSYDLKGGVYTDFGIGITTRLIKKSSLYFSLGHSYKELQGNYGIAPLCLECETSFYYYKFGYGRIIAKAGIGF